MKKTQTVTTVWRALRRKKPALINNWQLFLLCLFAFMVLIGAPILLVLVVAFPSGGSSPVNWKIALPFLVLYIGWWLYCLLRGVPARAAQLKARIEAKQKQRTRKALQIPQHRASRGGTDAA